MLPQNLSEEVEVEQFYEFFSQFGDILQCKTEMDQYGQVGSGMGINVCMHPTMQLSVPTCYHKHDK